jgi:hypothetical protein
MASGVWSEWAQTLLAPPLAFLQQDLVPGVLDVWLKMQVPSYPLYQEAVQTCVSDAIQSTQSTTNLLYLTLRPVILLLGMALQLLGTILHILFQHLLEHGWHSLQKGAMQGKAAIVWFYIFQKSLSRKEVLGEVGLVIVGILGYYLRKWLKRQTYVARANKWYQQRKRKVTQVSNSSIVFWNDVEAAGTNAMVLFLFSLAEYRWSLVSHACQSESVESNLLLHVFRERRNDRQSRLKFHVSHRWLRPTNLFYHQILVDSLSSTHNPFLLLPLSP